MADRRTRSEEESYRVPFFILCSLVMGAMLWLVYQEAFTRRPWKDIQLGWFKIERARAEKNLDAEKEFLATGEIVRNGAEGTEPETIKVADRLAALNKTVAELEGGIIDSPRRIELEHLRADLEKAEIRVKDAEMRVAFAKADEDAHYYIYRHAKHEGHAEEAAHAEGEVKHDQAHVAEMGHKYDEAVRERDLIVDKIDTIQRELAAAKREIAELQGGVTTAQHVLETTAERYTGIEQYWNQSIDLVDRCHTCHLGTERCGYAKPEEILHEAATKKLDAETIRKTYCTTREEAAAYVAAAEEVSDSFGEEKEKTFEDVKGKLGLDKDPVILVSQKLGMKTEDADALFRSHPDRLLLLGKHPGGKFGCTTCHYGQGRQTKGVGLNLLAGITGPFDHARNDHYWEKQLLEVKDRDINHDGKIDHTAHHVEASCFNCHKSDYELAGAPNFTRARKLVQHLGCTGCHPLGPLDPERKHGPELNKVAQKAAPGWLVSWIRNPKGLRPRTRMPNFWPEAIANGKPNPAAMNCNIFDYATGNPPPTAVWENCLEKRDRESAYIAAFLISLNPGAEFPKMPASANAEKGKQIFENIGCRACHNMGEWNGASHMPGSDDRDLAPNLNGIGDKVKDPGWFFAWVRDPKSYWHETRMPKLRLSEEDAWDVAAYLSSTTNGGTPAIDAKTQAFMDEKDAAERGRKLVNWYGCFGCHDIKGFEKSPRIGVDLTDFGSKLPSKLDFGDVPEFASDHHAQTWQAWTETKVKTPRIYRYERVETRMPQFDLSEQEVKDAILFLKSQNNATSGWPENIRYKQSKDVAAIQRGYYLIDVYNCRGCHQIDNTGLDIDHDHKIDGGQIYALFAESEEKFRAPPKLINQGRKVYPDWLYGFLKEPFKLRENFVIRMPTFQFSDDQAADLVAHFSAKAGVPYPYVHKTVDELGAETKVAAELFEAAQCLKCHNLTGISSDPKNIAPNLRLAADRLRYDWLFDWLKDPQAQIPGVAMPGFFNPDDEHPGEYQTPLPQYAGGDWRKQISLLRAYVISLGAKEPTKTAAASTAEEPKPAGGGRRKRGT